MGIQDILHKMFGYTGPTAPPLEVDPDEEMGPPIPLPPPTAPIEEYLLESAGAEEELDDDAGGADEE